MGGGWRGGVEGEGGGQAEGEAGEGARRGDAPRARPRGGTLDADEWDPDSPCEFKGGMLRDGKKEKLVKTS